ncbi:MAG: electron transfer flavoprotein subunit beta/FixA family protein [Deltaproteobacteria bacterium]|nr:electron transfer flavoprotein subunit beta/FixA family protein [Deltaproteobacteria bacterium]
MKIFILIKQVPNTTQVKLDQKTGSLIREGVEAIMNPEDRHALEAGVGLKEGLGQEAGVEVTALTMGPPQAVDILTEALGMGADGGVLLTDRLFAGSDTWATSLTLARAVEVLGGADLVLCGRQAIDGDTAQIGPQVAEALGLAQATGVFEMELSQDQLKVSRQVEAGYEKLELTLPALVTVTGRLNRPRYPQVADLLAACEPKARIRVMNAADLGFKADEIGLEGSLTQVIKTFSPKAAREGVIIDGPPGEAAAELVARLKGAKVISGGA